MKKEKAKLGFSGPKANAMKKKKSLRLSATFAVGWITKPIDVMIVKARGRHLTSKRLLKPKCMWQLQQLMLPAKATPLVGMYLRPLWQIH